MTRLRADLGFAYRLLQPPLSGEPPSLYSPANLFCISPSLDSQRRGVCCQTGPGHAPSRERPRTQASSGGSMLRSLLILFGLLLASTTTYSQRALSADSQTLQALLEEVRQLRQDLRTTSVTSVRAQILLHRVQIQEAAVVRLSQRAENAQARLGESQSAQQR